jgi:hypothetical protein
MGTSINVPNHGGGTIFSTNADGSGLLVGPDGILLPYVRVLSKSAVPTGIPPSSNVGANGLLTLGTFPAGSLTFGTTSGVGITCTGVGTSFVAADVGRCIVVDAAGNYATITAYTSALIVTVTIVGTLGSLTYANNAWQLVWPFANTYPCGIWLYFPAGAVYAGSLAGSYWCVPSSIVRATIYDNRYTSPGTLTAPASPTPIVAAGPGVFTQSTSEITVFGYPLKGNMFAPNSAIRFTLKQSASNYSGAGSKQILIRASGTQLYLYAGAVSSNNVENIFISRNRGVVNSQLNSRSGGSVFGTVASSINGDYSSIDFGVDNTLTLGLLNASASDMYILESHILEMLP